MTLEYVKCCRRPAHLPNALVWLAPDGFEMIEEGASDRPPPIDKGQATLVSLEHRVSDLAINVELELRGGRIANANRRCPVEPREPRYFPFREAPFTAKTVHDLQLIRAAGNRAQQPVAPIPCLLVITGTSQCKQGEGRVPEPAVAVVPVAHAAGLFG